MSFTQNVSFDTVAREWRCKWSEAEDKKSLSAIQSATEKILASIKAVDGIKDVQRVVCGGCLDYKLIISLEASKFDNLEKANLEEGYLAEIKAIPGVTSVETQSFTLTSL